MELKNKLKKSRFIMSTYRTLIEWTSVLLTLISPELNSKFRYRLVFKKKLNLNQPTTFNEKIMWLKLNSYMTNPLVITCADKYKVRKYVRDCGLEYILNGLIGVYNDASEIPWEELPNQFALKWNFGAGMNIICTDKSKMNKYDVISQMNKWGKNKCWLSHSEMQYKYIEPKIICERLLNDIN